jgi:tRNA pseudouridine55 synthase
MKISQEELTTGKILHFDKPLGWTSFQLVKKIRYLTKAKKVGHAGTLDPLATGVLIICLGKSTKKIAELQMLPKVYTGIITLGATTPCFDLEQEIDATYPTDHITEAQIHATTKQFTGIIQQTPPAFSAVKVKGRRAYDIAREGNIPEIKAREAEIASFEIPKIDMPHVHFRIVCSKGTYIRSIARDFGLALGSGAHLTKLVREAIGNYTLDNCETIDSLIIEPKHENI